MRDRQGTAEPIANPAAVNSCGTVSHNRASCNRQGTDIANSATPPIYDGQTRQYDCRNLKQC
jgi:hypothetical protein